MAGYGSDGEHGEADDLRLLNSLPPAVVAALSEPFSVTEQQRQAFARDGFCLCKQLLPPLLLQALREAIAAHTYARNPRTTPLSERNTYDRAFIQVGGMWQHGGCAKALTFSKRLASTAAGLMGTKGALLHHDQALFKEPSGGHTPWHCDQQYWPLERDGSPTISAWIPLCDCPLEMGPLMFATGSHQWGAPGTGLHDIRISDESEQAVWQHIHAENSQVVTEAMSLGDVSFHHGWTLHRADPNGTLQCREAHTIQYAADTTRWSAKANGGATGFGGVRTPGARLMDHGVPILWLGEDKGPANACINGDSALAKRRTPKL